MEHAPGLAAAMDLGSNLVRVAIGARSDDGNTQVIHKEVRVARIAEGLGGMGGTLGPAQIRRAIEAVGYLNGVARSFGIKINAAVATGALRMAANRSEAIAGIFDETGVHVDVIDGFREGGLAWRGVRSERQDSKPGGTMILVDIGGTTTEVIIEEPGSAKAAGSGAATSFEIGVITLGEWALEHGANDRDTLARAAAVFRGMAAAPAGAVCLAAGGAAVALTAWRRREPFLTYVSRNDDVLSPAERLSIYQEFLAATPTQRGQRLQVSEEHAALVPAGYAILDAVTAALGVTDVHPTGRGVVEGLLDEVLATDR